MEGNIYGLSRKCYDGGRVGKDKKEKEAVPGSGGDALSRDKLWMILGGLGGNRYH